jgi:hypothetical protein
MDATIQSLVMIMDAYGWEQDGEELVFIHVAGDGERRAFADGKELYDFISVLFRHGRI